MSGPRSQAKEEAELEIARLTELTVECNHVGDAGRWAYLYDGDGKYVKCLMAGTWSGLIEEARRFSEVSR